MRYVTLKTDEIEALEQGIKSSNNTIRKRSHCLLLSGTNDYRHGKHF